MKKKNKTIMGAIVVIAVAVTLLITPSTAMTNQEEIKKQYQNNILGSLQVCPSNYQKIARSSGNILISPDWYESDGDDTSPAITLDAAGHIVITWTNYNEDTDDQGDKKGYNIGITYSSSPPDQDQFQQHAIIYESFFTQEQVKVPDIFSSDIALIQGPEANDYKGLFGVVLQKDMDGTEYVGFYKIPDITGNPEDPNYAEFSYWVSDPPESTTEVKYAVISDGGYFHQPNSFNQVGIYDGIIQMFVYHFHETIGGHEYDIINCPSYTNYNIRQTPPGGTATYFDGQGEGPGAPTWCLKTAPAIDPDYILLSNNRMHLTWQYHDKVNNQDKIVWKKVVGTDTNDADIEYTHYQKYIAEGTNPAIAGRNDGHIAIVFMDDAGNVKFASSSNDGVDWTITTIASGKFPDIYDAGGTLFCSYIHDGNLYIMNSTDDGTTWTTPRQINDVAGSVVEAENSVDIHRAGIVWVDSRNADKDIYFSPLEGMPSPPSEPKLDVTSITGGLKGAAAVLKNTGDAPATNVDWTIKVTGGILGRINKTITDTIETLAVNEEKAIGPTGTILGFGSIQVLVTATCAEGKSVEKTKDGTQFIIFTIIK
ncbi:MAG: hypothetical protein QXX20_06025 [Candidatus Thermoplasmatota archaeon]